MSKWLICQLSVKCTVLAVVSYPEINHLLLRDFDAYSLKGEKALDVLVMLPIEERDAYT